jgi:hypothetical protein
VNSIRQLAHDGQGLRNLHSKTSARNATQSPAGNL